MKTGTSIPSVHRQGLAKGTLLTASDVGVLAAVGATEIDVYRQPTVAVLSTGNELTDSRPELPIGCIRDTNRPTLLALLRHHGLNTWDAGIALDDPKVPLPFLRPRTIIYRSKYLCKGISLPNGNS